MVYLTKNKILIPKKKSNNILFKYLVELLEYILKINTYCPGYTN